MFTEKYLCGRYEPQEAKNSRQGWGLCVGGANEKEQKDFNVLHYLVSPEFQQKSNGLNRELLL